MSVIDPPPYTAATIEPIDVIESWGLGFNCGNAIKYMARAGLKDDRERDLEKALNYLHRELTGRWLPPNWREVTCPPTDIEIAVQQIISNGRHRE